MINDNVCKYARCRIPLTTEQIKAMNGEKICLNCLQNRIKFQQQNGLFNNKKTEKH